MKRYRCLPLPRPNYRAFHDEIAECRRASLGYVASCPVSFLVIAADNARRAGNKVEALSLETAAMIVSRSHAVAITAARRGNVRMKAKPVRGQP